MSSGPSRKKEKYMSAAVAKELVCRRGRRNVRKSLEGREYHKIRMGNMNNLVISVMKFMLPMNFDLKSSNSAFESI